LRYSQKKREDLPVNALLHELFQFGVYKRNQGRIVRQVTLAALVVTAAMGFYRLHETLRPHAVDWSARTGVPAAIWHVAVPFALTLACAWIAFRLINFPRFADFMIAVEAEMNKVSWPARAELIRASLVVLVTIIVLAVVLYVFDYVWLNFFVLLKVFPQTSQAIK